MNASFQEFAGFGSDFKGFSRRPAEDTVHYSIYVVDKNLSDTQNRARLNEVFKTAKELVKSVNKDYIWHNEPFNVDLNRVDDSWVLRGSTNFASAMHDEWLVVHILRAISNKFDDVWIRVHDEGGEFLLAEAYDVLPGWAEDDEVMRNRVWLHDGVIRLISIEAYRADGATHGLKESEALRFIKENSTQLCHVTAIDQKAFFRIRNYPQGITENLHHSVIVVPRKVAYLLRRNPTYVSSAIEAFFLRDPSVVNTLKAEDTSRHRFPPRDFVKTSVRFNRVGFAQLKGQYFVPASSWKRAVSRDVKSEDLDRVDTGLKLTYGFEMLLRDQIHKDKRVTRELALLLEDLDSGEVQLPSDEDIACASQRDDSEAWRRIGAEELEDAMSGNRRRSLDTLSPSERAMREDIRQMTERFHMNKDLGHEEGEGDFDDGDDDTDSQSSDQEIDLDQEAFARMMHQAMGVPASMSSQSKGKGRLDSVDEGDEPNGRTTGMIISQEDNEEDEIRKLTERFEAELNAAGAFRLDDETKRKLHAAGEHQDSADDSADEGDDVEIDFAQVEAFLKAARNRHKP